MFQKALLLIDLHFDKWNAAELGSETMALGGGGGGGGGGGTAKHHRRPPHIRPFSTLSDQPLGEAEKYSS